MPARWRVTIEYTLPLVTDSRLDVKTISETWTAPTYAQAIDDITANHVNPEALRTAYIEKEYTR